MFASKVYRQVSAEPSVHWDQLQDDIVAPVN